MNELRFDAMKNLSRTTIGLLCFVFLHSGRAFVAKKSPTFARNVSRDAFSTKGMWGQGLDFGKGQFKFYRNFDDWMSPFPDEDRAEFPEIFNLPAGVFEVCMTMPLGIVFEEIKAGEGVYVAELVEGGIAEKMGKIMPGDVLVGVTAVKVIGAKYERRLIPSRLFDLDTAINAISSNDPKWGCQDVMMMFERPSDGADPQQTDSFLEFFQPPSDSAWRQRQ